MSIGFAVDRPGFDFLVSLVVGAQYERNGMEKKRASLFIVLWVRHFAGYLHLYVTNRWYLVEDRELTTAIEARVQRIKPLACFGRV